MRCASAIRVEASADGIFSLDDGRHGALVGPTASAAPMFRARCGSYLLRPTRSIAGQPSHRLLSMTALLLVDDPPRSEEHVSPRADRHACRRRPSEVPGAQRAYAHN